MNQARIPRALARVSLWSRVTWLVFVSVTFAPAAWAEVNTADIVFKSACPESGGKSSGGRLFPARFSWRSKKTRTQVEVTVPFATSDTTDTVSRKIALAIDRGLLATPDVQVMHFRAASNIPRDMDFRRIHFEGVTDVSVATGHSKLNLKLVSSYGGFGRTPAWLLPPGSPGRNGERRVQTAKLVQDLGTESARETGAPGAWREVTLCAGAGVKSRPRRGKWPLHCYKVSATELTPHAVILQDFESQLRDDGFVAGRTSNTELVLYGTPEGIPVTTVLISSDGRGCHPVADHFGIGDVVLPDELLCGHSGSGAQPPACVKPGPRGAGAIAGAHRRATNAVFQELLRLATGVSPQVGRASPGAAALLLDIPYQPREEAPLSAPLNGAGKTLQFEPDTVTGALTHP